MIHRNFLVKSRFRHGALLLAVLLLAGAGLVRADGSLCPAGDDVVASLVLATQAGSITFELYEDAAPRTVRRLVRELVEPGRYDGLTFDYTQPHVEIRTEEVPADEPVRFVNEIDAGALGLDRDKVENQGKAMDVVQRELLKAFRDRGKQLEAGSKLAGWISAWYESQDPSFLIGVSRQEILEALGHVFTEDLPSRPVSRGALALKPAEPGSSTSRITVFLTDVPNRNGRWMVIGRVVEGQPLADEIALRPLERTRRGDRDFRPLSPLEVESLRFVCRPRLR